MRIFSQDLFMTMQQTNAVMVTISVVKKKYVGNNLEPAPTATVTLTAEGYSQVNDTITVPAGTKVHCKTVLTNYNDDEQDIVAYDDTTVEVKLNNRTEYQFSLTLTPAVPFTLVCLDENNNPTGRTSSTGSILIPENYKVRAELQNPEQFTVDPNDYTWTVINQMTVNRALEATVTFGTIIPHGAQHEFSVEDNQFTTPDYNLSKTTLCTNRVDWRVSKPGYETQTGTVARSGSPVAYFTNQTLPTITLSPTQRTFTVTCDNLIDATVTIGVNGVEYSDIRTKTVTCYIGDVLTWRVQREAYETQTGSVTQGEEQFDTVYVTLPALYCYVTVNSTPPQALVEIYRGDTLIASGTGTAAATCIQGETNIKYKATYDDQTQEVTITVPAETSHTYIVTLAGMSGSVMILTSTGLQHLVVGQYKFIAISGAGAGSVGRSQTASSGYTSQGFRQITYGPSGGSGGGAGNILTGTFNVATEQDVYVTIGAGGVSDVNNGKGGITSLMMNNVNVFSVEGGDGGAVPTNVVGPGAGTGGNGTSGGGAGGNGGKKSNFGSGSSEEGSAGANGGLGGGNGAVSTSSFTAGTGALNTTVSYETNAGAYVTDVSNIDAGRGGGGRGLVSIQSAITPTFVYNLNNSNMYQLYNSMGGGGSGGGSYANMPGSTTTYVRYGPPGGGGGSWTAGSMGTSPDWPNSTTGTGGTGGSGVIILCRISWS